MDCHTAEQPKGRFEHGQESRLSQPKPTIVCTFVFFSNDTPWSLAHVISFLDLIWIWIPSVRKPASDDGAAVSSEQKKTVPITFMEERPDGSIEREVEVQAVVGDHLLDAAHANNVELEGACGGELACSTCHLVFEPEIYDKLPTKSEEEDDMLDLAFSVTDT